MTTPTRTEKDPLGTLEVPADAYYGIQTARAIANFPISGRRPDIALVRAAVQVKKAAARANRATGRLPEDLADAIIAAADEILGLAGQGTAKGRALQATLIDSFRVDPFQAGAGVSHNMNTNEVLANRAIEILGANGTGSGKRGDYSVVNPNDHVNMAQSTNDTFPTAMRLAALDRVKELLIALEELVAAFEDRAQAFDSVLKAGRTHMQDAVPIRLGQEFAAYALTTARARQGILQAAEALAEQNIGATAVGTGLNAEPEYISLVVEMLSEQTGYRLRTADSLVHATQSMAPMLGVSAALRGLAVDLSKICEDLLLMSSGPRTGFAEIRLPARQPGSSIMPGKVNPVMVENLSMICYHVVGADTAVAWAVSRGQLELNVMMPLIAHEVLESLVVLTNGTRQFATQCVAGIEADVERAAWLLENSSAMATPLAPYIGYALAAEIAKQAVAEGRTIRELVVERGIFTAEELAEILDPHELTRPGIAGGMRFEPRLPKGHKRPTGPAGGGG
ncbi:MAG TPA: aspartate ammonia-lyase [Candidatus Limnocylindrales bacterium]|jgi:aspartate ammonia-lyase|nr:aspartate ammonia-lyase [Candidatus Limnocylindrales bacterium]